MEKNPIKVINFPTMRMWEKYISFFIEVKNVHKVDHYKNFDEISILNFKRRSVRIIKLYLS